MEKNILSYLSKEEKKLLRVASFKKNEIIFNEGEICNSIAILIEGRVEIISYSFSGKEVVFNIVEKNQIFGNNLLFSSDPTYKGNVMAVVKSLLAK